MTSIEINAQFERALELLNEGCQSLFITGKAGTGKSTLLDYFRQHSPLKPVILAPTGVAALNVKGQTIHSFFNFYIDATVEKIRERKMRPRSSKIYKAIKIIIIDEISMVRADLLDCIDTFLRLYGPEEDKPFGGVQMVFVGDLYQLPPVVNAEEMPIFTSHYTSPYFFSARVFQEFPLEIIELEKVYRQKDQDFVDLLNRIRNNTIDQEDLSKLNQRFTADFKPAADEFFVHLSTTNQGADQINDAQLHKLVGRLHCYKAEIRGDFSKEYFPTATALSFKIGSQVMLLNNDPKKRWVNGSMGIIESIKTIEEEEVVGIRLQGTNRLVEVPRYTWEVVRFKVEANEIKSESVGTFSQFPLRLAWAVTIHKSQGKTFEKVVLDLGRGAFATGQVYVGLSRCTSFEGVFLKTPVQPFHIRTDRRIHQFFTAHAYKKAETLYPRKERVSLIEEAIVGKNELGMTYLNVNNTKSERIIRPLGVGMEDYQGKSFPALRAVCSLTKQEQIFHVGRILELRKLVS